MFKNTVSHVPPKHLMRQMKPYCFAVTKFKTPFYLINTLIQISIQRTNKFLLSDIETKATSLAKGFWRAPKLLKVGITDGRILILSTLRSHFLNYLIRSVSIHTACYLLKWLNQKGYLLIQSVNISKPKVLCVTFSPMLHFFKKKNRVLHGYGLIPLPRGNSKTVGHSPPPLKNFWKCPFPIIKIFCKSWLEELLILSLKRITSIQIKVLSSRAFLYRNSVNYPYSTNCTSSMECNDLLQNAFFISLHWNKGESRQ